MRQYLSPEEMEEALEFLDSQMDQEAHQEEIERIKRAGERGELGYSTEPKRHVLWSDGSDTTTFRNNKLCWPRSKRSD